MKSFIDGWDHSRGIRSLLSPSPEPAEAVRRTSCFYVTVEIPWLFWTLTSIHVIFLVVFLLVFYRFFFLSDREGVTSRPYGNNFYVFDYFISKVPSSH